MILNINMFGATMKFKVQHKFYLILIVAIEQNTSFFGHVQDHVVISTFIFVFANQTCNNIFRLCG